MQRYLWLWMLIQILTDESKIEITPAQICPPRKTTVAVVSGNGQELNLCTFKGQNPPAPEGLITCAHWGQSSQQSVINIEPQRTQRAKDLNKVFIVTRVGEH